MIHMLKLGLSELRLQNNFQNFEHFYHSYKLKDLQSLYLDNESPDLYRYFDRLIDKKNIENTRPLFSSLYDPEEISFILKSLDNAQFALLVLRPGL